MAFDSAEGVAVLFGGGEPYTGDTWTYNLSADAWKEMKPPLAPCPRMGQAMAYDRANGVMVLFGGIQPENPGGYTFFNDTWVYDLGTNTWTHMYPPVSPPRRTSHRMVYDSANGVMVLFGGANNEDDEFNDTWTYNLTTNSWTNMNPPTAPSPRYLHGMVYDEASGIVVLFGGGPHGEPCQDTWTYDVATNDWTLRFPNSGPSSRAGHAMVYDSDRDVVLLFGGISASAPYRVENDTWTYSSSENAWTKWDPPASPSPRGNAGIAYDDRNKAAVMIAGHEADNDTWIFRPDFFGPSGTYTSRPFDTGGRAYFGDLGWTGSVPPGTDLGFQLRTGDTPENLSGRSFIGPDGTPGTFYRTGGQGLAPAHNGSRWIQYRAHLATKDQFRTPLLENVSIRYNLLHSIAVISPAGSERWSGKHDIKWVADDPDNDTLRFDIYLLDGNRSIPLASDLGGATWEWDTATAWRGNFRIRIVARDDDPDIPLSAEATSGEFSVFNNRPPTARLLGPADGSVVGNETTLTWTGEDADNDPMDFFVFLSDEPFDTDLLPPAFTTTGDTALNIANLTIGRTYYWTVMPNDGTSNGTAPEVWRFRANRTITITLLSPPDKSYVNSLPVRLRWHASTPDGAPLFYILCLRPSFPPYSAGFNTSDEYLDLGDLYDNVTYNWSVSALDNITSEASVTSEYWTFTVRLPPANIPVRITSTPPDTAWTGQLYSYNITTVDEDLDIPAFALLSGPPGMALDRATGRLRWTPDTADLGNHTITVQASDGRGSFANQTFTLRVLESPARPPVPPTCKIISPANGSRVGGTVEVRGIAAPGRLPITAVLVRIDGSDWELARGLENWNLSMNTVSLAGGRHRIEARSFDGTLYSNTTAIDVTVRNPEPPVSVAPCQFYIPVIFILAAAVFVLLLISRKRQDGKRHNLHEGANAKSSSVPGDPAR